MNYGNPHKDTFVPNFPGRPTNMRRYERRERARPSFESPLNPGGQRVDPESLYGGKPFRPMPGNNSMTPYDWKNDPNNLIMELNAGVDFGNRRPMYDKNGKLIQQRPVLKDTSTVPVPIMDYVGSMTAMAGKKTGKRPPLAMVPGNVVAPNVPEHTGHSNDMFKEDPYRSYNSGYRYNAHGLQPLYFG